MTKKVLIAISSTLVFILLGLVALYIYTHKNTHRHSETVEFIPGNSCVVVRVKQTSSTLQSLFSDSLALQLLHLEEVKQVWNTIDSVTSRNYKTAEILASNTSYICLDSALQYLILVDLNKRTNEHFIDQFLVNSSPVRKITRFKEGYKCFYTSANHPLYYFVRNNIFGISSSSAYLMQAIQSEELHEKKDTFLLQWEQESDSRLSLWFKKGHGNLCKQYFPGNPHFTGWMDTLALMGWMDVTIKKNMFELEGEWRIDTLSPAFKGLHARGAGFSYSELDSLPDHLTIFSAGVKDSSGKLQVLPVICHSLPDSNGINKLLITIPVDQPENYITQWMKDSLTQVVVMADPGIGKLLVVDKSSLNMLSNHGFYMLPQKVFVWSSAAGLFMTDDIWLITEVASRYETLTSNKTKAPAGTLVMGMLSHSFAMVNWSITYSQKDRFLVRLKAVKP